MGATGTYTSDTSDMLTEEAMEREGWKRAMEEYEAAYKIARKVWPENTPPEVIQSATATLLIHHKNLAGVGSAPKPVVSGQAPAPAASNTTIDRSVCPECNGPIYDNRAKNVERIREGKKPMPDYKCKAECGWVQWPAKGGKGKSNPVRAAAEKEFGPLDEVPVPLQDETDDLPF